MKKLTFFFLVIATLLVTSTAFVYADAHEPTSPTSGASVASCKALSDLNSVVNCAIGFMQIAIYFLIAIAMVYTLYCAFRFIGSDGEGKSGWRGAMLRGLIALFVMVSVWGILNILTNTFGFGSASPIVVPVFGQPSAPN